MTLIDVPVDDSATPDECPFECGYELAFHIDDGLGELRCPTEAEARAESGDR